jgi:hypothetical protein
MVWRLAIGGPLSRTVMSVTSLERGLGELLAPVRAAMFSSGSCYHAPPGLTPADERHPAEKPSLGIL